MSQKVFVLDDDQTSCDLARQALDRAGFEVETSTRAIGATAAIRSFSPDLILLDVMMPAVSGENVVEIIDKILKPRPKILYYSNKSSTELRELVNRTKVEGFVCKVDGPTNLVKQVRQTLGPPPETRGF